MPVKGEKLTDPTSGNIIEFIDTAKDTDGKFVKCKVTINPAGKFIPKHYHILQDEQLEVISGNLGVWYHGKTTVHSAGDVVFLKKNTPHNHYNAGPGPLVYSHTSIPGLDFDYFMETLGGLGTEGKLVNGWPSTIQQIVSNRYLQSKAMGAGYPVFIQKLAINIIAPIACLFGYRAVYKKYSGIEIPE